MGTYDTRGGSPISPYDADETCDKCQRDPAVCACYDAAPAEAPPNTTATPTTRPSHGGGPASDGGVGSAVAPTAAPAEAPPACKENLVHPLALKEVIRSVQRRINQGDCPTEPAQPREVLEEAIVEMLHLLPDMGIAKAEPSPTSEASAGITALKEQCAYADRVARDLGERLAAKDDRIESDARALAAKDARIEALEAVLDARDEDMERQRACIGKYRETLRARVVWRDPHTKKWGCLLCDQEWFDGYASPEGHAPGCLASPDSAPTQEKTE